MQNPLTILATPVNAVGHVNACSGALAPLLRRGHRVIFIIEEAYQGQLSKLGYEELIYSMPKSADEQNPGEVLSKMLLDHRIMGDITVWQQLENMKPMIESGPFFEECKVFNGVVKQAIADLKPDVIYFDGPFLYPAIHYSGVPFVRNNSGTPLCYIFTDHEEMPPGCSGFPTEGNRERWAEFNVIRHKLMHNSRLNQLVEDLGYPRYPECDFPESQTLTVYAYPEELNYPYFRSLDWINLEVFNKDQEEPVALENLVPKAFLEDSLGGKFSGKLVYISMGSMGAVDVDLMKRIIEPLGRTAHKYIVSKGMRHEEYDLPQNMWGDRYLPQTKILPHVDLVITHGGNNTTTETFAQGKPMIVLPLFGDQFDNAQRLLETGLGARLEPYRFTENQIIETVDRLLRDERLKEKLQKASTRILNSNQHELLANRIEQIATKD